MGQVSQNEDIEERRWNDSQNHILKGIRNLRVSVSESKLKERLLTEDHVKEISERITKFLDDFEQNAKKIFGEANKLLHDPRVNFVSHSNKQGAKLADVQAELSRCKTELNESRASQTRLIKDNNNLKAALEKMTAENATLNEKITKWSRAEDDARAWGAETKGTKRK